VITAPESRARPGRLEHWALHSPEQKALVEGARSLTWREWNDAANRIAEVLHARGGVGPGERVAVCMQNRLEWFVTQAATAKLGAALVPISQRLTPAEIHYIVADCKARAFAFDAEDVESLSRVWTDRPPTDTASAVAVALSLVRTECAGVIRFEEASRQGPIVERVAGANVAPVVYTSGTTGRPRGVVLARTGGTEVRVAPRPEASVPGSSEPARNLLGAPLNHAAGQASARATHAGGGCVYIMPRFDAEEALRIISREKITTTFLVPTMLNRIVSLPAEVRARYDVSSIRVITTGASRCPQSIKEKVIEYFGGHCLYESYGSTEVGLVSRMRPEDHLRKPGSCGRLLPNVELKLVGPDGREVPEGELGEICVRTPVMIESYLNRGAPDELADGFFATGDVGRLDEDGFLYIVDRKKDMIVSGGFNIFPREVEDVLSQHADVAMVAVVGIPDDKWGEAVTAVVVAREGARPDADELINLVKARKGSAHAPKHIKFVTELPMTGVGKVDKKVLKAGFWAGRDRMVG
jgi:long-chain acyl-CoA synthetase